VRAGAGGIILRGSNGCAAGRNTAINNILVDGAHAGFDYLGDCGGGGNSLFSNNLLFGNAGGDFAWGDGASSACDVIANTLHEDPASTFANFAGGDYHLKATSLAVGHGTTACTPGQTDCTPAADFDGVTRPPGAPVDIGAYAHP